MIAKNPDGVPEFLSGGGEMGSLTRAYDWSSSSLGAPAGWPQSLRTSVRLLLNSRHPMFIWWGPQLIQFYNDAYRPSIGLERHPAALGQQGRECWAEIWPIIGPQIEQVMQGKGSVWFEDELVPITRHGKLENVYWTYSYSPIDDPAAASGVGGVLVICSDTTNSVVDLLTLRAEREKFAQLFEQAPTFMAMVRGPDHRIEMTNPGYQQLIGNRAVLGKTAAEAVPELIDQGYIVLLDQVYASGEAYRAFESKFLIQLTENGAPEERYLDFVYQPLRDNDGVVGGVLLVGVDVTERALGESRFRDMADNMSQLAWMADASGAIFWYNRRWFEYTGTTLQAMTGWAWRVLQHPDHVERVVEAWGRHIAEGTVYEDTFPILGVDGGYRWFLTRVIPLRDAEGRVSRWFGTNTDISDQLAVEEALRDADRRKDEFLATLAHELRNPLAPIRNALEMAKRAPDEAQVMSAARDMMVRQVDQMSRLIDELMDLSRVSRGIIELHRNRVSLSSVIAAAVEMSRPLIERSGNTLDVRIDDAALHIDGDSTRLAQVFTNLLNNAAKFTPRGGQITLTLKRDPAVAEGALIRVHDTGMGIQPGMLERIFDMFTQGDASMAKASGGLGIGLTLVRKLIEMHGGNVKAFSEGAGLGSEFRIRLPLSTQQQTSSEPVKASPLNHQESKRIVVADDNADSAESLSALLQLLGHQTMIAYDGSEACKIADEFRPEVMVMDLGMPVLDGYAAARQIRTQSWGADVLLIAVSGWGQKDDKRRSKEAGFDHHFVKPLDLSELEALLAKRAV